MDYESLKKHAKKLGIRVTKDVQGKRVKLTKKELESKLKKTKKTKRGGVEKQAKSALKFIRICKTVLREAQPNQEIVSVPTRRVAMGRPPPPPPPPPPRPMVNNQRAKLLAELRANPKFRNLRVN
tara:strand:- start:191 stop:565 length:375 start_codon:yes stop_codon:yes gene_type:complete